jgi:hypothetical protein
MGLAGCSAESGMGERAEESAAAVVTPNVCADLVGSWTATLSNVTAMVPIVGTVSATGSLSFTIADGATPDQATLNGMASVTVPGIAPINQPFMFSLSGFSTTCDGRIHADSTQNVGIGTIHFVLDGALVAGSPETAAVSFTVDTPATSLLQVSASGTLNLTKQ